jgi:phosphoglycerol transferase MdoB-like AlkP superfamily enzyme
MQHSIVFENAWSNGTKSIEGIPAILSSMPSWMDNPFINSLYCNNNTQSFPMLLKKEGYFSAFFHGGINGTMNFDAYSRNARFDKYYGKQEYNNDADFDGYWGIWDEPFLQFVAKEIGTFKEPFFASIFTLSSHHPFNVPEKYKDLLPKGTLPIHQSVAYYSNANLV